MGDLEKRTFENLENKPHIYARYIDDTFIQIEDEMALKKFMQLFQENSVPNFTYEMKVDKKLPFLDVLLDISENRFKISLYHKPTDNDQCFSGNTELTKKHKNIVINYSNCA